LASAFRIDVPIISSFLSFLFLFWSRKAEYTCDRGGILASRDPRAAIASMCKLAVGPVLFKKMSVDDFLKQHMDIDQSDLCQLSEKFSTHPYLVKRIHAILEFYESDLYRRLVAKHA
jgi:Zn-dependent protease with chaperone function